MNRGDLPKPDEVAMAIAVLQAADAGIDHGAARIWCEFIGMNLKRNTYILAKWTDRGHWNYGVTDWGGWFTPAGIVWARSVQSLIREEMQS